MRCFERRQRAVRTREGEYQTDSTTEFGTETARDQIVRSTAFDLAIGTDRTHGQRCEHGDSRGYENDHAC